MCISIGVDIILTTGPISMYFARKNKGTVTYSHVQHTREEGDTVYNPGFLRITKTGLLGYWVPSPSMVLCDTKTVFTRTCECIARLLQVRLPGKQSFGTNHCPFVAVTVHLEVGSSPMHLLLDIVEVAVTAAFARILQDLH
ncbi:hypothetical protein C8Q70DRAFT_924656 [Cubamyces menziesii]|nr:hypothetical protein C8Q70DRAFT_924656 [Cubamyces menziesii]